MNNLKFITALLMFFSIALVSCEKEDPTPEGFTAEFSEKNTLKISTQLEANTDSEAQTAYTSADAVKQNIEAYSVLFNVPANAEYVSQKNASTNASGTWTWTYGYYDVLFTLTETTTQNQFTYDYDYNGSTVYSITGWENLAQTQGHYEAGYVGYNSLIMDWDKTSTGYHITMDYTTTWSSSSTHYDANFNNDGSGDYSQTLAGDMYPNYTATWNALGAGTATYYDGSTGTVTSSYTF